MQKRTKMITRISISLLALGVVAAVAVGCGGSGGGGGGSPTTSISGSGSSTAGGAQVLPVAKNPISNNSNAPGLEVTKALVENNVDPDSGKAVDDHLELAIKNTTGKALDKFEVYYTVSDPKMGVSEGYFTKLAGFVIDPGATRVAHFDNTGQTDHYPINEFGLYTTDTNALVVEGVVSSPDVKPATFQVNKDAGGAENGVE